MTDEQANAINLAEESNQENLRNLVKFWQNKAYEAEKRFYTLQKILLLKGTE